MARWFFALLSFNISSLVIHTRTSVSLFLSLDMAQRQKAMAIEYKAALVDI